MSEKSEVNPTKVKSVAHEAYNETSKQAMWPDCWDVSQNMIDHLFSKLNIPLSDLLIVECYPKNGYEHYVVEITQPEENILIDGSYKQFSYEADTPVSIDYIDKLDCVAIFQPNTEYPFYDSIRDKQPATDY